MSFFLPFSAVFSLLQREKVDFAKQKTDEVFDYNVFLYTSSTTSGPPSPTGEGLYFEIKEDCYKEL